MKKKLFSFLTATLSISTVLGSSIMSYAYEEDDFNIGINEESGEKYWYLEQNDDELATCNVIMYILVDKNDLGYISSQSYYTFDAYTNIPDNCESIHLCHKFLILGQDPYATLENGYVYLTQMWVEPGDYTFSFPNASGNNDIRVLTGDFESPMVGKGHYISEKDPLEVVNISGVKEAGTVHLYAYLGSDEWCDNEEMLDEYKRWAKADSEEYKENLIATYGEKAITDNNLSEKEQILEEEEVVEEKEEFVPTEGDTRSVSIETSEIVPEEPETKTPSKLKSILIAVAGFGIIIGFGVFAFIKKQS